MRSGPQPNRYLVAGVDEEDGRETKIFNYNERTAREDEPSAPVAPPPGPPVGLAFFETLRGPVRRRR